MGSLPAAPLGGSGAEKERDEGGDGSLKELVVFLHVARVPGMGGRLVTLMGQLGAGGRGVGRGRGGWGGHRNFPEGSSKGKQREEGPSKGTGQRGAGGRGLEHRCQQGQSFRPSEMGPVTA